MGKLRWSVALILTCFLFVGHVEAKWLPGGARRVTRRRMQASEINSTLDAILFEQDVQARASDNGECI